MTANDLTAEVCRAVIDRPLQQLLSSSRIRVANPNEKWYDCAEAPLANNGGVK